MKRTRRNGVASAPVPPAPDAGDSRVWVPLLAVCCVLSSSTLPVFLTGAMSPFLLSDVAVTRTDVGYAVSAFFVCSALSAPVAGMAADRLTARWSLPLAALGAALATSSISLANGRASLVVSLCVAGVANALAQTAGNLALADRGAHPREGAAFGVKQSALPLATLLAGLAVPVFDAGSWRWAFLTGAGLTLVIGLMAPLAVPRRALAHEAVGTDARIDRRLIALLTIASFLATGVATSAAVHLVDFGVVSGWNAGSAGLLLALTGFVSLSVRIVSGLLVDRYNGAHREQLALRVAGALVMLGAAGLLALAFTGAAPWLVAVGAVLGIGVGWGWPGLMHLVVVRRHRASPGRATGIVLTGVFSGSVAMPPLLVLVVDATSYAVAWGAGSLAMALAAVLLVGAGSSRPAHPRA